MHSKNWKFHKRFGIPQSEELIEVFGCSTGKPPKVGNLFLSENHVSFYSNILSHKTKRVIPLQDIVEIRKAKVVGIKIFYRTGPGTTESVRFSGFKKTNEVYEKLLLHWKRKEDTTRLATLNMGPAFYQPPPGKSHESSLGVLFVTIVEGKEMPRNVKGPVRAYCTLSCGDTFYRTKPADKSFQPKWGHKFAFPLKYTEQVNDLVIQVFDDSGSPALGNTEGKEKNSSPDSPYSSDERRGKVNFLDELNVESSGELSKSQRNGGIPSPPGSSSSKCNSSEQPKPGREGSSETVGSDRLIGSWSKRVVSLLRDKHLLEHPLQPHPIHDKWVVLDTINSKGLFQDEDQTPKVHIYTEFFDKKEIQAKFWSEIIRLFDTDGNGEIDRWELATVLQSLGTSLSEEEIDHLFSTLDLNGDGRLSPNELSLGDSASFMIQNCPHCNNEMPASDDETVFHLGTCLFDNPHALREHVLSGLVTPVGKTGRGFLSHFKKQQTEKETNGGILLVHDRDSGRLIEEKIPPYIKMAMDVLYGNRIGKKALNANTAAKFLRKMTIAQGKKYDDPISKRDIEPFIKFHQLNEEEILEPISSFRNFNEFFYRKLVPSARPIFEPNDPHRAVSPADCRMMAFSDIDSATRLWIKGRNFSLDTLLLQPHLVSKYEGGSIGVFRLAPQDYHRFHVPVNGIVGPSIPVLGKYYTVNPIAVNLEQVNVFGENKRVITEIESPEFGSVCYVAIGATMVGSIVLTTRAGQQVSKGDEHGYFAFGGSTIVLLFQRGKMEWDPDILHNSLQPVETLVKMGNSIGRTPKGSASSPPPLPAAVHVSPSAQNATTTPIVSPISRKRIALRSSNGKYLVCRADEGENEVVLSNSAPSDFGYWYYEIVTDAQEQHILEENNVRDPAVLFQHGSSKYVEKQLNKSEKRVIKIEKFALRNSGNGKYLSVKTNGELVADRTTIGPWEIFTKERRKRRLPLKRNTSPSVDSRTGHRYSVADIETLMSSSNFEDYGKEQEQEHESSVGFLIRTNNFGRYMSALNDSRACALSDVAKKSELWFSAPVGNSMRFSSSQSPPSRSSTISHQQSLLDETLPPHSVDPLTAPSPLVPSWTSSYPSRPLEHIYTASPQPPHLLTPSSPYSSSSSFHPPPSTTSPQQLTPQQLHQRHSMPLPLPLPYRAHTHHPSHAPPTYQNSLPPPFEPVHFPSPASAVPTIPLPPLPDRPMYSTSTDGNQFRPEQS